MNKRKKMVSVVFAVLFLPLTVLMTVQCQHDASDKISGNSVSRNIADGFDGFIEEKTYSTATIENRFADDRVVIVLNKAASMNFKTYTPEDFPEINCIEVMDSTRLTMEVVRQQLEAERTGDWRPLEKRIKIGMLVDVDKFRRILDIALPVKSKENVLEVIKRLEGREDILYAGPDYFMELCAMPNPTPGLISNQMDAINSISLPAAWDITTGSSDVLVGVLDTGIQGNHPSLSGLISPSFHRDFTTSTNPQGVALSVPVDSNGHGTLVAGIIGTNGLGVIGTNWNVSLVSLRVHYKDYGVPNSSLRYAVDFAGNHYIPILTFSGGDYITGATDLLISLGSYSGLFVCAAGNNNYIKDINPQYNVPFYPASYTTSLNNVISVGAMTIDPITKQETLAGYPDPGWGERDKVFSNYGTATVDLFAPGTSIWSTLNNTGFYGMSGTSVAAPFVAGVAALIKSLHPSMTGAQLKTALKSSVDVLSQLNGLCSTGGKINAYKAVRYIPIVGSMNLYFNGTGYYTVQGSQVGRVLIGKLHLFTNGNWAIVESEGTLSTPISGYSQYSIPSNLEYTLLSTGIQTYLSQNNKSIYAEFLLKVPASDNNEIYYLAPTFIFNSNGYRLYYSGARPGWYENLTVNDKRRIKVGNRNGSVN